MRFRCNNRVCTAILWVLAIAAIALTSPLHAQTIQVKSNQKIADNTGGFGVTLTNGDQFGFSATGIGDLDNDGVEDLAVGANRDATGGTNRGALARPSTTRAGAIAALCTCFS